MIDNVALSVVLAIAVAMFGIWWKAAQLLQRQTAIAEDQQCISERLGEHSGSLAKLEAQVTAMDRRQDKNFHELGTAWIEMRCRIERLEDHVLGSTKQWTADIPIGAQTSDESPAKS